LLDSKYPTAIFETFREPHMDSLLVPPTSASGECINRVSFQHPC